MTPTRPRPAPTPYGFSRSAALRATGVRTDRRRRRESRFAAWANGLATTALIAGSLGLGSAGCEGDSADHSEVEIDEVSGHGETERRRAQTEINEAERAIADYEYAQREELVADIEQRLAQMARELDEMEATLAESTGQQRLATQLKLAELRTRWNASKKELKAAEAAVETEWETAKDRLAKAYASLQRSVNEARQRASDRIEPQSSNVTAQVPADKR